MKQEKGKQISFISNSIVDLTIVSAIYSSAPCHSFALTSGLTQHPYSQGSGHLASKFPSILQ